MQNRSSSITIHVTDMPLIFKGPKKPHSAPLHSCFQLQLELSRNWLTGGPQNEMNQWSWACLHQWVSDPKHFDLLQSKCSEWSMLNLYKYLSNDKGVVWGLPFVQALWMYLCIWVRLLNKPQFSNHKTILDDHSIICVAVLQKERRKREKQDN